MRKLRWSLIAQEQMAEIFDYYKNHYSLHSAKKIVQTIKVEVKRLKQQAYIGTREPLLANRSKEYRYLVVSHYKVLYCIEEDNFIHIVVVFDCRQNPSKLISYFR